MDETAAFFWLNPANLQKNALRYQEADVIVNVKESVVFILNVNANAKPQTLKPNLRG